MNWKTTTHRRPDGAPWTRLHCLDCGKWVNLANGADDEALVLAKQGHVCGPLHSGWGSRGLQRLQTRRKHL